MKNKLLCSICLTVSIITAAYSQNVGYRVDQWEISRDTAVKNYFSRPECSQLSFPTLKEYDNKIYAHIITINPEINGKITILRSEEKPVRDLLFINGKLFSILERRGAIDSLQFKTLFVQMKDSYGLPQMTKENDYTVYTYKTDTTQALIIAKSEPGERFDVKVYIYSSSLFRKVFLEQ